MGAKPHGEKVSDCIFRLHEAKGPVQLEVVFIHGLEHGGFGDAYWETWVAQDGTGENVWPMTWLPDEFPCARVFALRYDGSIKRTASGGRMDLFVVGETLVQEMVELGGIGQSGVPVVLVCHGFGGLVAKQIVVFARRKDSEDRRAHNLLQNIGLIFFYCTPHRGSDVATGSWYGKLFKGGGDGPLLENLKVLDKGISRLNKEFEEAKEPSWLFASVVETHETVQHGKMVVEEASARYEHGEFHSVRENHFDVVRPKSKKDSSYQWLVKWLKEVHNRYVGGRAERLVPESFVRLKEQEEAIKGVLGKVPVVGVIGMGGVGKTTLVKAVYESIYEEFEKSSYLDDVKSKASLEEVLVKLGQDVGIVAKSRRSGLENSEKAWLADLKKYMQEHKVLVVVDDVGTRQNLEWLMKELDFLHWSGESKLIVTCRNWQELEGRVQERGKYEVECMKANEGEELFMCHAFDGARTLEQRSENLRGYLSKDNSEGLVGEFERLCDDVLKACGGFPLSLEMMGGYLGRRLKDGKLSSRECLDYWRGALGKLYYGEPVEGGDANDMLWKVLHASYDDLCKNEKSMFLDIACFFCGSVQYGEQTLIRIFGEIRSPGENRSFVTNRIELRNFIDRCLIKVKEDGIVAMHEQLRDMGRSIARAENSTGMVRMWDSEDVREVLRRDEIFPSDIRGLSLEDFSLEGSDSSSEICLKCPKLRFLNLSRANLNVIGSFHSEDLGLMERPRWKRSMWWVCLKGTEIREVPMFVWVQRELYVLDLSNCKYLQRLGDSIGSLILLLELDLSGCYELRSLPDSIGNLTNLSKLALTRCEELSSLPDSIGNLSNLSELRLNICLNLQRLPDAIGNLANLSKLDLSECWTLEDVPDTIGKLGNLSILNFRDSFQLTRLPDGIGNLVNLSELSLEDCAKITKLPGSIGNLAKLSVLNLEHCELLESLPDSIGNLINLSKLNLYQCRRLKCLPDSIGNLVNLLELNLDSCVRLLRLPDCIGNLSNLVELHLRDCKNLANLPDSIGNLSNLSELNLYACKKLTSLPDSTDNLTSIQIVDIRGCESLTSIPDFIGDVANECKLFWESSPSYL